MGRKRIEGISRTNAIQSKKVTGGVDGDGKGWEGQNLHDGSLGNGLSNSSRTLTETMLARLGFDEGIQSLLRLDSAENRLSALSKLLCVCMIPRCRFS